MIALSIICTRQTCTIRTVKPKGASEKEWKGEIGKNDKGDSLFDLM